MTRPAHPGTIVYVDGATQQEVRRLPVEEVPESMRFRATARGLVPVVKVVAIEDGNQRSLLEYGPDGEFLFSTLQRKR